MRRGHSHPDPVWIGTIDDRPARETPPWRISLAALFLLAGAWLGGQSSMLVGISWGLGSLLVAVAVVSSNHLARARHSGDERRGLLIDGRSAYFATGPDGSRRFLVLATGRPFGLTLLCNSTRERLVLAITTSEQTLYLGASLSNAERNSCASFLGRASTVGDDDPVLAAIAPDGRPIELAPFDLVKLYRLLIRRDERAPGRCFLSDTHGANVVLDGDELRIGERRVDLKAPLEWRALWFQEALGARNIGASDHDPHAMTGGSATWYQATWIRQESVEAVFVALVPSVSGMGPSLAEDGPELIRARLRDQRLMTAMRDAPPPHELRVAIERTYMVPLRAALDRAPRKERMKSPPA